VYKIIKEERSLGSGSCCSGGFSGFGILDLSLASDLHHNEKGEVFLVLLRGVGDLDEVLANRVQSLLHAEVFALDPHIVALIQ
jgi:hypothetical protein